MEEGPCHFMIAVGRPCTRPAFGLFCWQHLNIVLPALERPLVTGEDTVLLTKVQFEELRTEIESLREQLSRARKTLHHHSRNAVLRKTIRAEIITRDDSRCRYCGVKVEGRDLHLDHYEPDGPTEASNLVVACRPCNIRKGALRPRQLFKARGMKLLGKSVERPPFYYPEAPTLLPTSFPSTSVVAMH